VVRGAADGAVRADWRMASGATFTFSRELLMKHLGFGVRTMVVTAIAMSAALSRVAVAQKDANPHPGNRPVAPFRIAPNLYYVGLSDVTSYLFTSPGGDILLDGGYPENAPRILENIKTLGFNPKDVKILINSHAHFDHAGGLAELKKATGAKLFASAEDAKQLREGGRDNYGLFDKGPMPAVVADSLIANGALVRLGGWTLRAAITPAHTRGCTNWVTTVESEGKPVDAVFMCGASVPGYTLVGNKGYPTIVQDYEKLFPSLRALPCQFFFAAHAGFFDVEAKAAKLRANASGPNPFIDPAGCRQWIDANERAFKAQVAKERGAAKP
jgi:metallo-beta-lactamase class B